MIFSTTSTLPRDVVPNEHQCIIGRGRVVKLHKGNVKFDAICKKYATDYKNAASKSEKGNILTRIVNEVHEGAPDAGFVRKDPQTGAWTLVTEDSLHRQTVAQAMRNVLYTSYRSSKQFKSKRRAIQIQQAQQLEQHQTAGMPQCVSFSRCVSPSESCDCDQSFSSRRASLCSTVSTPVDTLDLLIQAFAPIDCNLITSNPFEPRPIAEDLFEPFPLPF
jgi:hypothetical protein